MKKILDISSNSSILCADNLKNYDAVYIKITEGCTYITDHIDNLVNLCRLMKVPYGLYHFAGKIHSAQDEYNFYKQTIAKYTDRTLPDCLDYEQEKEDINFINQFMSFDSNLLFYSYRSLCSRVNIPNNKKWVAIPGCYGLNGFIGVQYVQDTNVTGINNCDVSNFDDSILNKNLTPSHIIGSVTVNPMKIGEKSKRVQILQCILNSILSLNLETTSMVYGQHTKDAVTQYQTIMGIPIDGDAGEQTMKTLFSDMQRNYFVFN